MKTSEIRDYTDSELAHRQTELRRELWKARFDNHTNQLDDTNKIRRLRRDIAKINTILGERSRQKGQ